MRLEVEHFDAGTVARMLRPTCVRRPQRPRPIMPTLGDAQVAVQRVARFGETLRKSEPTSRSIFGVGKPAAGTAIAASERELTAINPPESRHDFTLGGYASHA